MRGHRVMREVYILLNVVEGQPVDDFESLGVHSSQSILLDRYRVEASDGRSSMIQRES